MNIFADESVDKQIVDLRRTRGHKVVSIAELDPGIVDETVLLRSHESNAVLLTADKDFGDLVFRQRLLHSGILLIRIAGLAADFKAELVAATFDRHGDELQRGFAVSQSAVFASAERFIDLSSRKSTTRRCSTAPRSGSLRLLL